MIENFLRPPTSIAEYVADALRLIGVLSVGIAAVWFAITDVGIVAFALPALVAPRFIGVPPVFDSAFCVTVLVAAWSNVFDLYRSVVGWDIVMHFVCTALMAPMLYLLFVRLQAAPAPGSSVKRRVIILSFVTLGLAISALWEMVEWVGYVFISDDIYVEYHDTIGDMAVGGLGALITGIIFALTQHRVDTSETAVPTPT